MTRDPWWWSAACKNLAPLFDADNDSQGRVDPRTRAEREKVAIDVCSACTVRAECWADARIGRDEGVRAGRVLPPIEGIGQKRRVA